MTRSLVAFTSAGAPGASPRRVVLGNISAGEIIKGLPSAPTSVLSIHLSATRVVAVMKARPGLFSAFFQGLVW